MKNNIKMKIYIKKRDILVTKEENKVLRLKIEGRENHLKVI